MQLLVDGVQLPAQRAPLVGREVAMPGQLVPAPARVVNWLRRPLLPVHANQLRHASRRFNRVHGFAVRRLAEWQRNE
jgi:hypothetical protein